jgi:hypothetical protein
MKFECGILQNRLQQMRDESFRVWQVLQGLKQEKHFVSNELSSLKVMTNNYSNEKYLPECTKEDISFAGRTR